MSDIDKQAMTDIMNGIADAFDKETPAAIEYKGLREDSTSSLYEIFSTYEMAAFGHVLTVNKILKQKYGIKRMDDELYHFIVEFPAHVNKLSKEIERDEGHVCCVDKAWSRSMAKLQTLIEANLAKELQA